MMSQCYIKLSDEATMKAETVELSKLIELNDTVFWDKMNAAGIAGRIFVRPTADPRWV
jgi:hypothetical protein